MHTQYIGYKSEPTNHLTFVLKNIFIKNNGTFYNILKTCRYLIVFTTKFNSYYKQIKFYVFIAICRITQKYGVLQLIWQSLISLALFVVLVFVSLLLFKSNWYHCFTSAHTKKKNSTRLSI